MQRLPEPGSNTDIPDRVETQQQKDEGPRAIFLISFKPLAKPSNFAHSQITSQTRSPEPCRPAKAILPHRCSAVRTAFTARFATSIGVSLVSESMVLVPGAPLLHASFLTPLQTSVVGSCACRHAHDLCIPLSLPPSVYLSVSFSVSTSPSTPCTARAAVSTDRAEWVGEVGRTDP